jgi:hypothetical protein
MGFLYNQPGPVSSITPAAKDVRAKAVQVDTSTTANNATVRAWLPANSSILDTAIYQVVGASTTTPATITIGVNGSTNNVANVSTTTLTNAIGHANVMGQLALGTNDQPGSDIPVLISVATGTTNTGVYNVVITYCN